MSSSAVRRRIVIDDAIPFAETLFGELGTCHLLPGREIDAAAVREADALIIRSRTRADADLLAGSRVRFVGSTVVGLDHVDQAWLAQQGITFYSAQGCNSNAVSEYVISALLQWAEARGHSLSDMTLAIIGVGHVGRRVWHKARALGMRCLLNDPPRAAREPDFPHKPLAQCLQQADIITLHVPWTRTGHWPTDRLLNARRLAQCRNAALIINAARGEVVDEPALSEHPADKIIDCWQNEPFINEALFQQAWLATPHIAGHSLDAKLAGALWTANRLRQHWQLPPLPVDTARQLLPEPTPKQLHIDTAGSIQKTVARLCQQAWDFHADHRALQSPERSYDHKNFEYHRRHYPPRREWHAFHLNATGDNQLDNLLKKLGFSLPPISI